ncbi:MAG TPA: M48 family metalloprotease [Syntrophorhabdaceae bacterium]|nr:M48 family metalloprotease [Syntrophorhabdaceae bacterium]
MKNRVVIALVSAIIVGFSAGISLPTPPAVALDQDEKMLWSQAQEEQRKIARSGLVYEDENLTAYLNNVLTKLLPEGGVPGMKPKVVVLKNRAINAFTFPDGTIYINSCMLALMENEAQLAVVLAHEAIHAINHHTIKEYRNTKSKTSFLASITVVGAWVGAGIFGAVGTMAAVTGYSRALETEADMEGLPMVVKAGYDPAESIAFFSLLEAEAKEENVKEPFFFGSHPRLQERKGNCEVFMKSAGNKGGSTNREGFAEALSDIVFDSAWLELKAGRFNTAKTMAERYRGTKDGDPKAYYLLGEIFRQRGDKGDQEAARENYTKAIFLDESYGDPYKALGLMSLKLKENENARRYFGEYLARSPDTKDRAYIEEYLKGLE